MANLEGRTLDRYELRRLLGKGGMADVYLGYDTHFEREVAVKVFKREDEDLLRRFIREAQLMVKLSNPHLMQVYTAGNAQIDGVNMYYIVMPFMSGGTLRSRIRGTPLAPKIACRYLRDIADALDYMHAQGIIHRDIKASNILIDAEGRCYLSDFGIARTTTDATQMTSTGNVLGTVEYMAPELFESDRKADAYTDLYALGILLFEMVTGRLPFTAESQIAVVTMHVHKQPPPPHNFVSNLSPAVERVILKSLEKQPEKRYGSAAELADAFCRAIDAPVVPDLQVLDDLPTRISTTNVQVQQSTGVPRQSIPAPVTRPVPALGDTSAQPISQQFPARSAVSTRRRRPLFTQGRVLILLVIIAVLALLVPIIYAIRVQGPTDNAFATQTATSNTQVAQSNASATAQAKASATATVATATAQAKATATQTAKNSAGTVTAKTATAVAIPSATAGVLPTATAGQPIYSSALTSQDPTAKWDENGNCAFQSDGYHVHVSLVAIGGISGCREANQSYTNFAAQVNMQEITGTSGGLFFHVTPSITGAYAGYLFEIDTNNGQYRISRSDDFNFNTNTHVLQNWTASSAIAGGTGANTLGIWVKDGTMSFYINNHYLLTLQDTARNTGNLAFLARGNNGSEMAYSNLRVYNVQ